MVFFQNDTVALNPLKDKRIVPKSDALAFCMV